MRPRPLVVRSLGLVPYARAMEVQEAARAALQGSPEAPDTLLLLEHPPTITVGRHGDRSHLVQAPEALAAAGVELVQSTRGGHLTYHAPGQLVAYPILNLSRLRIGPKEHVERLCGVVVDWLAEHALAAVYRDDAPGVWVLPDAARKVASVGVHVQRGVTAHGVAVNLTTDLRGFERLHPCGFSAAVMTSLFEETGSSPLMEEASGSFARVFARSYGYAS